MPICVQFKKHVASHGVGFGFMEFCSPAGADADGSPNNWLPRGLELEQYHWGRDAIGSRVNLGRIVLGLIDVHQESIRRTFGVHITLDHADIRRHHDNSGRGWHAV